MSPTLLPRTTLGSEILMAFSKSGDLRNGLAKTLSLMIKLLDPSPFTRREFITSMHRCVKFYLYIVRGITKIQSLKHLIFILDPLP